MNKPKKKIRCAIYTRKSSEEGLELEFNSLDAQREAAESFIASQKAEGWVTLPQRYDDGGFSGGNMQRPALENLMRDIQKQKIDCVVVYKVDRLSRSLMDFSRIMGTFDQNEISFVSVTQQFNTTHSMGRLTLNILLSFAQFEREIIGERIRDKLAAQARRGKWTGGAPVLGYDVDRSGASPKLVINSREALRVREIFKMYLYEGSLLAVVKELQKRNWNNKLRTTRKGKQLGGNKFNKVTLHGLLCNKIYTGKIKHKDKYFPGEHEAIIDQNLFDEVQAQLRRNNRGGDVINRNKYGALLRGLLRCRCCDSAMTHTFTGKNKRRFYRYYRCVNAIKNGHDSCSTGTLPAAEIERVVVDEIRVLGSDEKLLERILCESQKTILSEITSLKNELADLHKNQKRCSKELQAVAAAGANEPQATQRIAELNDQIFYAQQKQPEMKSRIEELESETISKNDAKLAFADFENIWQQLPPRQQSRLLELLIEKVEYDGKVGTVSITFRASTLPSLISRGLEDVA